MIATRRFRPSQATIVAYLALFVALGGTTYAATSLPANSVGTKQLKNGAVTTAKLHDHAVTGAKVANHSLTGVQINASTLGAVPNAAHAADANRLAGSPPSTYLDHCPSGLKHAPGTDLCYDVTERPMVSWTDALKVCALAGLHLASAGELAQAFNDQGAVQGYQWTSSVSNGGGAGTGIYDAVALSQDSGRQITTENLNQTETAPYRCVTQASN